MVKSFKACAGGDGGIGVMPNVTRRGSVPCPTVYVLGDNTRWPVWSGDTVVRDEDDFLYFIGRKDEMIKNSGYRFSPTEVEESAFRERGWWPRQSHSESRIHISGQRIPPVVSSLMGRVVVADVLVSSMRVTRPTCVVPSRVVVLDELPRSSNGIFDPALFREVLFR